ncbi:sialyltransferase-like protein precursor [Iris pallida]|uniref:Sialyltransferase-like protein n=1 Tax=Iris pallida TaxID=29817 RepID=A0AAX6F445_IRIPA|nr:sialyltransferase-like protein precursor [Iris pallida]
MKKSLQFPFTLLLLLSILTLTLLSFRTAILPAIGSGSLPEPEPVILNSTLISLASADPIEPDLRREVDALLDGNLPASSRARHRTISTADDHDHSLADLRTRSAIRFRLRRRDYRDYRVFPQFRRLLRDWIRRRRFDPAVVASPELLLPLPPSLSLLPPLRLLRRRRQQRHPPQLRPRRPHRLPRPRRPPQQRPHRRLLPPRRLPDQPLLRQQQHPPPLRPPPGLLLPPLRRPRPHPHVHLPARPPPRLLRLQRLPQGPPARHRPRLRPPLREDRQVLLHQALRRGDREAPRAVGEAPRREGLPLLVGDAGGGARGRGLPEGQRVRVREGRGGQAPLPHQPEGGAGPARLRGGVRVLPGPRGAAGGNTFPQGFGTEGPSCRVLPLILLFGGRTKWDL